MPSYCAATDLSKVFTDIGNYDRKLPLSQNDWTVYNASDVDMQQDTGPVGALFRNGVNLGSPQINVVACNADGKWYYSNKSGEEVLYCFNIAAASTYTWMVAPTGWYTAQTNAISNASERLEGLLDPKMPRPLPETTRAGSTYDYDWPIVKATALLACIDLVEASAPGAAVLEDLRTQLFGENGIITQINAGIAKLSFEWTRSDGGALEVGAINGATTGRPVDAVGSPTVQYNRYKIKIGTGGTITAGTDNTTVTFGVTDLEGSTVVSDTVIDQTEYHGIGGGYSARFIPGVYTANDYWWLTVQDQSAAPDTSDIYQITLRR